jgi:exodeoxyribonuclease VIII
MLDLETMGTNKNAAIIAIGAVRMDLVTKTVRSEGAGASTFYRVVSLESSMKSGGVVDASTIMWWMKQSEEARRCLTSSDTCSLEEALKGFSNWAKEVPVRELWGNGSDFDNVILENSYARLGMAVPWRYTANRCYRTVAALHPSVPRPVAGVHHNALDDAVNQAKHLCILLSKAENIK